MPYSAQVLNTSTAVVDAERGVVGMERHLLLANAFDMEAAFMFNMDNFKNAFPPIEHACVRLNHRSSFPLRRLSTRYPQVDHRYRAVPNNTPKPRGNLPSRVKRHS